jgi:hypothetical protein
MALAGVQVATGSAANAAALSCTVAIGDPTQLYTSSVYTYVQVACNEVVSFIGGYVSLYRDSTWLGSADVYLHNTTAAYKLNLVSCVPGNYRAVGYGFANLDGGAPDVAQSITTATVAITCG